MGVVAIQITGKMAFDSTDCSSEQQDYSDVIWTSWRLESPTTPLFLQPLVWAHIKEKSRASRHWPFVRVIHRRTGGFPHKGRESTDPPVVSPHKGPVMLKTFPLDDVVVDLCEGNLYPVGNISGTLTILSIRLEQNNMLRVDDVLFIGVSRHIIFCVLRLNITLTGPNDYYTWDQ